MTPEMIEAVHTAVRKRYSIPAYDREDAAQEVFLRMLKYGPPEKNFKAHAHREVLKYLDTKQKHQIAVNKHQKATEYMEHPKTNSWAGYDTLFQMLDDKLNNEEKKMVLLLKTTPLEEIVKSKRFGAVERTYKIVHTIKQKINEVGSEVDE